MHTPSKEMYYYNSFHAQVKRFAEIAEELGVAMPAVVATHASKSVLLPVPSYNCPNGFILLRSNFHDINMCVVWRFPPSLTLEQVYGEGRDWDWYLGEIEKCAGYSWKEWSEEELADPRILRVESTRFDGSKYWPQPKRPEEKDRWNARLTSPEWHERDWSSGDLFVDGEMGPDAKFYHAERAFLQGISDAAPSYALDPWKPGKQAFTIACSWEHAFQLMQNIVAQKPPETS